ncbi:MAG: hypothetical protein HRT89_03315 [Lentisphaeria bacterium]|nr:hypothetical protein [Lentisphaeria bacterium]NQZ67080.1 hypothetical protein [Lentisphaeria bacterium]
MRKAISTLESIELKLISVRIALMITLDTWQRRKALYQFLKKRITEETYKTISNRK